MKAKVVEVFESIQGEGLYLGEKQIFVRFFDCNLNCSFCDTRPDRFMEYDPQELFKEIKLYRNKYHSISFTGGEPLLYKDFLKEMLGLTAKHGHKHYLETNGTLVNELEALIEYIDFVAMDLKLPSSTGMDALWEKHRDFLKVARRKEVFLKAIICQATKEEDLKQALELIKTVSPGSVLILQPNSNEHPSLLREKLSGFKKICAQGGVTACVIPQIHRIIGIK
ncbi:MAG: 7-carboxy-7-deazaguanine synthase QueE [Candidatus Omnitrophica bacterium]|nr:7-carboxy-7-deazaguanine synthase QueE [Candidatus Omnitrophota bacterium]